MKGGPDIDTDLKRKLRGSGLIYRVGSWAEEARILPPVDQNIVRRPMMELESS